jgi:G2/M phase-specific E3 ubiquitin-protein ligase
LKAPHMKTANKFIWLWKTIYKINKIMSKKLCDLCLKDYDIPALYGEILTGKYNLTVHYYCLLSSIAPQRGSWNINFIKSFSKISRLIVGRDNQGIKGFLENDVVDVISKIANNTCYICNKKSAATQCAEAGCNRNFHFICGRQNNCITQFIGKFKSFCHHHVPDTNSGLTHNGIANCSICLNVCGDYHPASSIVSKCCIEINGHLLDFKKECFLHSFCIQQYVFKAGYDSMCPICEMHTSMTRKEWQNQMRHKGIFIPMKMAEWENDPDFKKMIKKKCSIGNCPYQQTGKGVYTCYVCGCIPLHLKCAQVTKHEDYLCPKCFDQSFVQHVFKVA